MLYYYNVSCNLITRTRRVTDDVLQLTAGWIQALLMGDAVGSDDQYATSRQQSVTKRVQGRCPPPKKKNQRNINVMLADKGVAGVEQLLLLGLPIKTTYVILTDPVTF